MQTQSLGVICTSWWRGSISVTSGVLAGCDRYFPVVTRLCLLLILCIEATLPRHTCSVVESCDWAPAGGKWVDVMCTAFRLGPYTLPFQQEVEILGRITNPKGLLTPSEILQHWDHVGACQNYRCSDLPPETYQIRAFSVTDFPGDSQAHNNLWSPVLEDSEAARWKKSESLNDYTAWSPPTGRPQTVTSLWESGGICLGIRLL